MSVGAILGGGTRFVAEWRDGKRSEQTIIATSDEPARVVEQLCAFFNAAPALSDLGVAMFGPIELSGSDAGTLLSTPKPGWTGYAFTRWLLEGLRQKPHLHLTTDVGAAALAEHKAREHAPDLAYVTVGTGVGVGAVLGGKILRGAGHPEMGHLPAPCDDPYEGLCPFHGRCIEGVAAGPAIAARTGMASAEVPDSHPDWAHVARALGRLCANITLTLAPATIVVGGGVMGHRGFLRPLVAQAYDDFLGGYGATRAQLEAPCHQRPGLEGAFALAGSAGG